MLITRTRLWTAALAAGVTVALGGCGAASDPGSPAQKPPAPKPVVVSPEAAAQKQVDAYAGMVQSLLNSRGEEMGKNQPATQETVRVRALELACPSMADNAMTQFTRLSERREQVPDVHAPEWAGVGTARVTSSDLRVDAAAGRGTFTYRLTVAGDERTSTLGLVREGENWKICTPE